MDLNYTISTKAELAGAQAAADALEKQIGKAKALKQDFSDLSKQHDLMVESIKSAKIPHEEEIKDTEKLSLGKRELLESLRGITREYPILGELARVAFNPLVAAIFGIIGAVEIWIKRNDELTKSLGGIPLPDLGEHITEANNVAEAYDGIAKAVKGADDEFDSAAAIFERQSKATSAELAATKQLIEALKQKALAELDIEKAGGGISEATYNARKSRIETGASNATVQAEIDARNSDLEQKKDEAIRQTIDAATKTAKAAAIKLPEDDKAAAAQAEEFKTLSEARKKEAAEHHAEAARLHQMQEDAESGDIRDQAKGIAGGIGYAVTHGLNFGDDPEAREKQNARVADAQAKTAEQAAAAIDKKIKDREKLRTEAAASAAAAEKDNLGLLGQDDPNVVGSVAWQNAQALKTQGIKNTAAAEKDFAGDITSATKDLGTIDEIRGKSTQTTADAAKVSAALKDAHSAVADAAAVIGQLAGMGVDVADLKRQVAQLKAAVDHH